MMHFSLLISASSIISLCCLYKVQCPCNEKTEKDQIIVDCEKISEDDVPVNLNPKLTHLNLKQAKFHKLSEESFKPYENVISLEMIESSIKQDISDRNLFKPLKKLIILNLTRSKLPPTLQFEWPESLEILDVTGCLRETLHLTSAIKLKKVYAEENNLQDIPMLNDRAPVEYMNLKANPLHSASVASLARCCQVGHIDILLTGNSDLKTTKKFCECHQMNDWMKHYKIKTISEFSCYSYYNDTDCNKTISNTAQQLYEACLSNRNPRSLLLIIIIIVSLVILLLLVLVFVAYKYGSLQKKAELGEVEEITHKSTETSPSSSEEGGEEEPHDDTEKAEE